MNTLSLTGGAARHEVVRDAGGARAMLAVAAAVLLVAVSLPWWGESSWMREFVEMEPHEVCKEVGITTSNLHVTLYRARLRLRECLENRWFQGKAVA